MRTPPHRIRALVTAAALAAALVVAGCSSTSAPSDSSRAPSAAGSAGTEQAQDSGVLIDVRTPDEYAEGHLEGAVNIDFTSPDFTARIQELDPDTSYRVYCRSGNRSAQAVAAMREAGLTRVADLGGFQDAARTTGLETVTGQ